MADWDVVDEQDAPPPQTTSTSFVPQNGPVNAMMAGAQVTAPKVVATAPPRASTAPTWRNATDAEKAADPTLDQVSSKGQKKYKPATADAPPLSDDAVEMSADNYIATGALPNTGLGGAGMKVQILNRAADKVNKLGLTGTDVSGQMATFKANSKALGDQITRRSQIAGFEGTVNDSLTLAQQYADKALANTGFTSFNKGVNWWQSETGDTNMKGLKDAVQTVTNEYAKVITNATGGGVTSDAARAHAEDMLSTADSPQAFKEAVSVLQKEMSFRVNSMDRQISGLSNQLHSALGSTDNSGAGDYDAFSRAWQQKNNSLDGAVQAWQQYKRKDPSTPWRQAFPALRPAPAQQTTPVGAEMWVRGPDGKLRKQ